MLAKRRRAAHVKAWAWQDRGLQSGTAAGRCTADTTTSNQKLVWWVAQVGSQFSSVVAASRPCLPTSALGACTPAPVYTHCELYSRASHRPDRSPWRNLCKWLWLTRSPSRPWSPAACLMCSLRSSGRARFTSCACPARSSRKTRRRSPSCRRNSRSTSSRSRPLLQNGRACGWVGALVPQGGCARGDRPCHVVRCPQTALSRVPSPCWTPASPPAGHGGRCPPPAHRGALAARRVLPRV